MAAKLSSMMPRSGFLSRWLTALTMVCSTIGFAVGMICQACDASPAAVKLVGYMGALWVRALKLMVVPMIFTSMIVSVASASGGSTGAMASLAIRFYLSTTVVAACEGLIFFNIFSGAFVTLDAEFESQTNATNASSSSTEADADDVTATGTTALDTLLEFGYALVPDNLVDVFLNTQLLGLITVGAFIGASVHTSSKGQAVVDLSQALNETFVSMIKKVILLTPFGVGSLVAGSIAAARDVAVVFRALSSLLGVVFFAQLTHAFGFYSLLYFLAVRKPPLRYYSGLVRVWATAFGTSSSAATLSTTTEACVNLGVSEEAARFVLPIGATINMDGSALERAVVVLWIAHVSGVPISAGGQLVVAVTAILLSIGASPIPSAGVSTLIVMVEQAGVPFTPHVALATSICLAVEWLFDRVRTCVNVTGDAIGVAIVDALVSRRQARAAVAEVVGVPPAPAPEGASTLFSERSKSPTTPRLEENERPAIVAEEGKV